MASSPVKNWQPMMSTFRTTFQARPPMHPIPTADDFDIAKLHIVADLKKTA
jgi:hypothetical protein